MGDVHDGLVRDSAATMLSDVAFECALCGETKPADEGAFDAVERILGDAERGVCDGCFARLPEHVKDWADEVDRGD